MTAPPFDPAAALVVAAAGALYATGVRRLAARRRTWPRARAAAFAVGLAAVAVATQPPVSAYEADRFAVHAGQHLLLGMVGPALLALGAPATLALQAARRPVRRAVLRVLHARPVAVASHPAVAASLFVVSLFALYLTPLYELSLRHGAVHAWAHGHFLVVGCLFFWPVLGADPTRARLPHGYRLALVAVTIPAHAILGLALLGADDLVAPGFHDLADQRAGAGLLWAGGDLAGIAVAGTVLAQWMRHDDRHAEREDRAVAAAAGG